MKRELKVLYKKNPKLAVKIASVLGYKIIPKKLKKDIEYVIKKGEDLKTAIEVVKQTIKPYAVKVNAPDVIKELDEHIAKCKEEINNILSLFRVNVKKLNKN